MFQSKNQSNKHKITIRYERNIGSPSYWGGWPVFIGEYSDSLISKSLKNELISHSQSLIQNKNKLDYRNADLLNISTLNNMQIQDIIEPHNIGTMDYFASKAKDIEPWIPTVFRLNNKSKEYEIVSDIVDLPRFENESLYTVIQKVFNRMVPNIKKTMIKYPHRGKSDNDNLEPHVHEYVHFEHDNDDELDDKQYNVIIKMTDYQFLDGTNSSYGGGSFHSEGFEQEHIYGVAVYYFDISKNVKGGNLQFHDPTYKWRITSDDSVVQVEDNMCVFFVNKEPYLHKVNEMNIADKRGNNDSIYHDKNGNKVVGTRKVLSFFMTKNRKDTTENVMVNFQHKVIFIIYYYKKKLNVSINKDVIATIRLFLCGDIKHMKQKCDNCRRQRYEFGKRIRRRKDGAIDAARQADYGKCD